MIQRCPPTEMLEAFAAGACDDGAVGSHIEECAECRAALEECRESDRFLAGVRMALTAHEARGASEAPESVSPDMVSGYQIQEELHRGGQGVVYRAVQTRTRRTVAIKVLLGGGRATGRQKERFEREIRIAAGLRHPNIVAVHDSGYISDGRYGLVMEYIEGVPLDRWSRGLDGASGREARRGAMRTRLGVMAKVCDAVLCAHQHSIVHRDLKPANILVDAAGEPHILDFGIARDTGQHTRLTHAGEFAGTLAYASPEQVSGDLTKVDTRTDIYSLGVILYELVSGRMPYAVDGPMSEILRNIETTEPAPLQRATRGEEGPWVDGEVATIAFKAMAKDPSRRYQTAAGLGNDINRYLAGEAIEARRDSTWYVVRKTALRHRVLVGAAGLIFAILAAFGAAMAWQAHRLDVRGRELAGAPSASNVERGRSLAAAGQTPLAEDAIFPELIAAGVKRIDGPGVGFAGSPQALQSYWGLWDVFRSSRCVATLRTMSRETRVPRWDEIRLLYFDDGGKRLNAVNSRGRLVSWSMATWEPVRDITLFADVKDATFRPHRSPDGTIVVFGDNQIRVIDPETGRVVVRADDPDQRATLGTFSPDGRRIATSGHGNLLCVRDAGTLEVVVTLAGSDDRKPSDPPWSRPIFSPDGGRIAAARDDGSLGVWNATSGVLERTTRPPGPLHDYVGPMGHVGVIAFAPDGTIVSTWAGYYLVVWPADGGTPRDLGESDGDVAKIEFMPGSNYRKVVTTGSNPGGGSGVTIIWDVETGARVAKFKHPDDCVALAISPDARFVIAGMSNGLVQVHESVPEPHVSALQVGRRWPFPKLALSPDGRQLAVTTKEPPESRHDVWLIDLKTRTTVSRFGRDGPEAMALEFARDGRSLFEADISGRVTQWDLASDSRVREFVFPEPYASEPQVERDKPRMGGTNQMRLSPDGRILARARDDGLIGLWDVASGSWMGLLGSGSRDHAVIDFSPDSRTLVAHHTNTLVLWDVPTQRPKRTFAMGDSPGAVRHSPVGPIIARSDSGALQFFNAETGRIQSKCTPGTAGMGMAFQREGMVFCASAFDTSIRLWDTRTGRELLSLRKHTQHIRELVVSPDGNTLISSDWMGTVLVWDLTHYIDRIRRELANRVLHATAP